MKIITYLTFTMMSILMKFCVMDYIREKTRLDLNVTSPKKRFHDVLQHITQKPHALYYRTHVSKQLENNKISSSKRTYSNTSLPEISLHTSTDLSSTILDLLYDENVSVTGTEDTATVTESLYTSTEFDNVTEMTFFDKNNGTTIKPNTKPKKTATKHCYCNLLYGVCDINCCCDIDCTDAERKIFITCIDNDIDGEEKDFCYLHHTYNSKWDGANVDKLFCLAKTNLPDKRNIHRNKYEYDASFVNKSFKWHTNSRKRTVLEFKKNLYQYGEPLWLLRNGSLNYIDLPSPMANSYCTGRTPIKFLNEQRIKCNVKLTDLEAFSFLSSSAESLLISADEKSLNSSAVNCTTVHCTNWTIIVCNEATCMNYNPSVHEPLCTENICTHLTLNMEYIFYYHESKIVNATVKLYTQRFSLNVPFMTQAINVKFVMANKSVDDIVKLSGNPGYINGLPVIVSFNENNYTDDFFNTKSNKYMMYPDNKNGMCVLSNMTNNFVLFGSNRRINCRVHYLASSSVHNATGACKRIQNGINHMLGFDVKLVVSPYGNPHDLRDDEWISMHVDKSEEPLYGQIINQKLYCYNLITRISLIFSFADMSDSDNTRENKILTATIAVTTRNVTLNTEDVSTVITVDTVFIDATKPSVLEYAGGPNLNLHLPSDFFFPFPSNISYRYKSNYYVILYFYIATFIGK